MEHIKQIEQELERYIRELELTGPKSIKLILNKKLLGGDDTANAVCLHLSTKYKGLNWSELCVDDEDNVVLFIGRRY